MRTRGALISFVLGCLASSAPGLQGTEPTDPRYPDDPRATVDPRESSDPREGAEDPRDILLEGPKLYDSLFEAGEESQLMTAFREDGWFILGYIEGVCEAWLTMSERGDADSEGGLTKMADLRAKGRRLAELADQTLGDTRFTAYVDTFFGWGEPEQVKFRESQELFKQGVARMGGALTPQDSLTALTPLRQALERSREIGDTWGQSQALAAIGQVQSATEQDPAARATMQLAIKLGREIRDIDSVWEGLTVTYESAVRTGDIEPAQQALEDAYVVSLEAGDPDTARELLGQLLQLEVLVEQGVLFEKGG